MDGQSLDILTEKIAKLKELYPEAVTEEKIDWELLQVTLGSQINLSQERYHLNWAGKSEVFRVLQQRTSATLIPTKNESVNFDETENVFIEGENLEVLKVLQKSYFGKIKMIYIDPPYNTGSDSFIYPDRFSETKDEYLKRIGDKDEEGFLLKEGMFRKNSKDSGHYHSNWLSMMYPRLYLARNLLRDDGVIFVSIDDNEVHNLRMIMNEIFGEENFIADIIWEKRYGRSNDARLMASQIDHILFYRKTDKLGQLREPRDEKSDEIYSNPDNDPRGVWTSVSFVSQRTKEERPNLAYKIKNPFTNEIIEHPTNSWKYSETKYNEFLVDKRFYWGKDGNQKFPRMKRFLAELPKGMVPVNLWKLQDVGTGEVGTKEVESLVGKDMFDHPKPTTLIKRMLKMSTLSINDDIILDFFAGSGTTAQAVMELNKEDGGNRKFILVQLPEKTDENSEAYKAGYKSIADICKERIRRVVEKINHRDAEAQRDIFATQQTGAENLGFKVFKLAPSNFKIWRSDVVENSEELEKMMDIFDDQVNPNAEKENILYELMLKSGYQLTADTLHAASSDGNYYSINGNESIIILEAINQTVVDEVLKLQPKNVIALDKLFAGNDQLKTNTVLQFKDADIEFRTV